MRSFGVILGRNSNIFKPVQIVYRNEALGPVVKKKWLRGQPRSYHPKFGVFGVISGQNPYIFQPGQLIYQNEALEVTRGHLTPKRGCI